MTTRGFNRQDPNLTGHVVARMAADNALLTNKLEQLTAENKQLATELDEARSTADNIECDHDSLLDAARRFLWLLGVKMEDEVSDDT